MTSLTELKTGDWVGVGGQTCIFVEEQGDQAEIAVNGKSRLVPRAQLRALTENERQALGLSDGPPRGDDPYANFVRMGRELLQAMDGRQRNLGDHLKQLEARRRRLDRALRVLVDDDEGKVQRPQSPERPMVHRGTVRPAILAALAVRPHTVNEITVEIGKARTGILGHLMRLRDDGLVERSKQPDDNRTYHWSLIEREGEGVPETPE